MFRRILKKLNIDRKSKPKVQRKGVPDIPFNIPPPPPKPKTPSPSE